ncbi:hypothetical protein ACJX0J_020301, partial [Zea mays]
PTIEIKQKLLQHEVNPGLSITKGSLDQIRKPLFFIADLLYCLSIFLTFSSHD